ncbi:MAG: nicotinate phosphoribosyltransferase [Deltaproteobacteria bacterium]|nr:nicotinate phosphoribosyltransferase [Deltaproteobacteria bacterium]
MFHTADEKQIKDGRVTDVYFERTEKILKAKGIDKVVRAECIAKGFPREWPWAVFAGAEECANLLRDLPLDIRMMNEGTVFHPYEPVIEIRGKYLDFCRYETALLGLICQATGVATMAARCRKAAGKRQVISFGARRMHPAIVPMVDEVIEPEVGRVSLIDTFNDEKIEALNVARALGKNLFGIRLDTPGSRRGDFLRIMEEVRWELDLRGFGHVRLFLSGGMDEHRILEYNALADAYGVGTAISNAPVVDFSMDIIEIDGQPVAKRGKMSGSKHVFRCRRCFDTVVTPARQRTFTCECGGRREELLKTLFQEGVLKKKLPEPADIRKYVLKQLEKFEL